MRLHGFQGGIAQRNAGRLLTAPGSALPTGRRRSCRRASSPSPLGRDRLSFESRQNALADSQLIELVGQFRPFGIKPREPLGNPPLLLANLIQCRHLLFPLKAERFLISMISGSARSFEKHFESFSVWPFFRRAGEPAEIVGCLRRRRGLRGM